MLRTQSEREHRRVTSVELFFDLVFVFAITQLSHMLLAASRASAARSKRWPAFDSRVVGVDLHILGHQLARSRQDSRAPDAVRPDARRAHPLGVDPESVRVDRALTFAGAYVFMQVGRSLFMFWALRGRSAANFHNFQRIIVWLAFSGGALDLRVHLPRACAPRDLWAIAHADRVHLARRWASGCPDWAGRPRAIGTSKAGTWPNAAGSSSSSRWANQS